MCIRDRVRTKLVNVLAELSRFADEYKAQPTLAFTHFQPAQPSTVGKKMCIRDRFRHHRLYLERIHHEWT